MTTCLTSYFCGKIPGNFICTDCAEMIQRWRNEYSFTPNCLILDDNNDLCCFVLPNSLELDEYHSNIFKFSEKSLECQTGILSVIYWGFNGGNRGKTRCQWAASGHRGGAQINETRALSIVTSCKQASNPGDCLERIRNPNLNQIGIDPNNRNRRITRIRYTSELGQVSFSSKVATFMDLDNRGVYDSVIQTICGVLSGSTNWGPGIFWPVIDANHNNITPPKKISYTTYCKTLCVIRDAINHHGIGWKDQTGAKSSTWRAVDVERALWYGRGIVEGIEPDYDLES